MHKEHYSQGSFFCQNGKTSLHEGKRSLQELEEGPHNGPYVQVVLTAILKLIKKNHTQKVPLVSL